MVRGQLVRQDGPEGPLHVRVYTADGSPLASQLVAMGLGRLAQTGAVPPGFQVSCVVRQETEGGESNGWSWGGGVRVPGQGAWGRRGRGRWMVSILSLFLFCWCFGRSGCPLIRRLVSCSVCGKHCVYKQTICFVKNLLLLFVAYDVMEYNCVVCTSSALTLFYTRFASQPVQLLVNKPKFSSV